VRDYARQKLALRGSEQIGVTRRLLRLDSRAATARYASGGRWSADFPGWSVATDQHVDLEYDNECAVLSWWIESRRLAPAVALVEAACRVLERAWAVR
jgi:hypothetical protein